VPRNAAPCGHLFSGKSDAGECYGLAGQSSAVSRRLVPLASRIRTSHTRGASCSSDSTSLLARPYSYALYYTSATGLIQFIKFIHSSLSSCHLHSFYFIVFRPVADVYKWSSYGDQLRYPDALRYLFTIRHFSR